ncbi:hypothetical protein AGOR_G00086220 [Albula goreensis]|uniref:Protein FAM177A1-like n=1 Tax=Albula goreensis TaxID=1534307 RepID=A0A8T3DPF1_9TELE|nr:hypothetical protein AGOR_G00086220 [Albula goreensis]
MSRNHEKAPHVEETEFGAASMSQQKKVIYFANGETLEQDSSEEEESVPQAEPFSASKDTAQLSWKEYSWCLWMKAGKKSLRTCDFLGGKLANMLGLSTAKYQYAVDEYHRNKTEGSKHKDTDGAPSVREEAERVQLSPQKSTEYGATSSLQDHDPQTSPGSSEHNQRTAGSHNQGYQED